MPSPKIILAFDTAMSACSAALYNAETDKTIGEKHEPMNRGQAERLVPMIDELIKQAGMDYKHIDLIACTHGPGAFTGLRLSLATAKALSLSLNIPAIGISTLEAALCSVEKSEDLMIAADANSFMCALETKRKDYYVQIFDKEKHPLTPAKSISFGDLEKYIKEYNPIIIGDAVERLKKEHVKPIATKEINWVRCTPLAKLASRKYHYECDHSKTLEPVYLREADVSFPATKK